MKPIEGYDLVNEAGEFKKLPAGIYGVRITGINNVPEKEYLEVTCDIVKGEYANYFKALVDNGLRDTSKSIRSYKMNALPFFKAFITAVEKSNPGYKWDWDETKLVGKNVIAVFRDEEYIDKEGNVKTGIRLYEFRSLEAYKEGKIKVPDVKKVTEEELAEWKKANQPETVVEQTLNSDDLPF
jgi:hypothetical protein